MIVRSDAFIFLKKRFYSVIRVLMDRYLAYIPLILITILITLFHYEAEPFSSSYWNVQYKIVKISGFGFIYSGVIGCFFGFVPSGYLQPLTMSARNLKILIYLLMFQIFITCTFNWIYLNYAFDDFVIKNYSFIHNVKHTASYSLFSFLFYFLYLNYRINPYPSFNRNRKKKHILWIEKFKFIVEDILYIKSDGNYIIVYYLAGGKPEKKESLRCSLTEAKQLLSPYPEFEKVHKSCIVNFNYIESYFLKSNTMKLKIRMTNDLINVGRTLQIMIKPLLKNIPRE